MSTKRINVAVIFGGRSLEHEISVISAIQAMEALDPLKYEVYAVYISQDGSWFLGDALRKREFYKNLPSNFKQVQRVQFVPEPKDGGLFKVKNGILGRSSEKVEIDVFVPIFHGQYGEDGCIQGLFEMSDVAYSGARVLSSALAMDKYATKKYLEGFGIPALPSAIVRKSSFRRSADDAIKLVEETEGLTRYPLFVKPVHLGSSVGVSRADSRAELMAGLMKVFKYDSSAIVEPCVSKLMEVNVSVIEGEGEPIASVVEIPVTDGDYLSYEDKYMRGGKGKAGSKTSSSSGGMADLTRIIDPQDLSPEYKNSVLAYALQAYQALTCSGVVRFDFTIDLESEKLFFNELNPMPGSLSFYLWDKSTPQLLFSDILDRIIEGALSRHSEKSELEANYGFKVLA